jgi:tousled-like kinase
VVIFVHDPTTCFRQGAQFVEVWVDGFAFADLSTRQEELAAHREELERQKKQSGKKKGSVSSSQREQLEKEEILKLRAGVLKKVCWCVK